MKKLPKMIMSLFVAACILWSIYYVISMTDCCYIDTTYTEGYSMEKLREILPAECAATLQHFGYAYAFLNRFGNPVVIYNEPYELAAGGNSTKYKYVSMRCYDKRFINTSRWGLMQITPGMDVGEVISKVGLPSKTVPYQTSYYGDQQEVQYQLTWSRQSIRDDWFYLRFAKMIIQTGRFTGWETGRYRDHTVLKSQVQYEDSEGNLQILGPMPIQPFLTLSAGAITAGIILFRLKKKGLLCKKKQVQEQSDSSI